MRRAGRDDAGLTLAELLVTMLLFGIVGSLVIGVYTATTRTVTEGTARIDNTRAAETGMRSLVRHVRAATRIDQTSGSPLSAFAAVGPLGLGVYAAVGQAPVLTTYRIDAGNLVERTVAAAAADAPYYTFTAAATERVIATGVANTTADPLFRYYDEDGTEITATDATARAAVRQVAVSLLVQTDATGRVEPIRLDQRFYLPNLAMISE